MSSPNTGEGARPATFAALGLAPEIVAALAGRNITSPLPIQAATIADALAGRDVSGKAPTGSGKTLAFSLPVAQLVGRATPRRPRALVLAPTRELAAQITTELTPLLAARRRSAHAFYGGVGFGPQRAALRRGVDVVVACPGRLEDLLGTNELTLADVDLVVLDEADRMADMGFLPAVRRLLGATRPNRQTLLFSATLDGEVDVLVREYQRAPVRHEVVADAEELDRSTHRFHAVDATERATLCASLVRDTGSTVVFVRTKHGADRVARQLERNGVAAAAIHGDRSQSQRERALAAFRSGSVQALVATDVAARGIHVDEVACVIHYDLPEDAKTYVHRSGRTARAGASGTVVSFVTPEQHGAAHALSRALDVAIEHHGLEAPRPVPAAARAGGAPRRDGHAGARPGARSRRRHGAPQGGGRRTGGARRAGAPDAGGSGRP